MKRVFLSAILALSTLTAHAQIRFGGPIITDASTNSINGGTNVTINDADCNVLTPGANCTLTGWTASSYVSFYQTWNLTGTLTVPRKFVVALQQGAVDCMANGTNMAETFGGVTGTTVTVPSGSFGCIRSYDGVNFVSDTPVGGAVSSVTGSGTGIGVSPTTGAVVVTNTAPLTASGLQTVLAASPFSLTNTLCTDANGDGTQGMIFIGSADGTPTCNGKITTNGSGELYSYDSGGTKIWDFLDDGSANFTGIVNMSDGADANSKKIVRIANGTASDDAAAFGQLGTKQVNTVSSPLTFITGTLAFPTDFTFSNDLSDEIDARNGDRLVLNGVNGATIPGGLNMVDTNINSLGPPSAPDDAARLEDIPTSFGISGMTAGQVPIAATASTITSSKPIAGSGTGLTSGPTSGVTAGDLALFTGTNGQVTDGAIAGSNVATLSGTQTFTGAKTFPSPTFTGTVSGSGTIPLTVLATQAANTFSANVTGSTASPTAASLPSCSGASNALSYTSGTGLSCNASITAAAMPATGLTGTIADARLSTNVPLLNATNTFSVDQTITVTDFFPLTLNSSSTNTTNLIFNNTSTNGHNYHMFSLGSAAGAPGWGVTDSTSSEVAFVASGGATPVIAMQAIGVWGFASTSGATPPTSSSCDTGMSRDSAGVFDFGTCTSGSKTATLKATALTLTGAATAASLVTTATGTAISSSGSTNGPIAWGISNTNVGSSASAVIQLTGGSTGSNLQMVSAPTTSSLTTTNATPLTLGANNITGLRFDGTTGLVTLINGAVATTGTPGTGGTNVATQAYADAAATAKSYSAGLGGSLSCSNLAFGGGAGTLPSCGSVTGLDGTHLVSISTGTAPSAGATIFTITYTASRGHTSYCTWSPANDAAAGLTGTGAVESGVMNSTSYGLAANGVVALASSTNYAWNVSCP